MGDLTSLGIGGILAILVLREVFAFLTKRKINGTAGDRSVEYWQQQQRLIIVDTLRDQLVPLFIILNRIDENLDAIRRRREN